MMISGAILSLLRIKVKKLLLYILIPIFWLMERKEKKEIKVWGNISKRKIGRIRNIRRFLEKLMVHYPNIKMLIIKLLWDTTQLAIFVKKLGIYQKYHNF